jgi:hypothetical protein
LILITTLVNGVMPSCNTCRHPSRSEIERAIVAGESDRTVSLRFPEISRSSIRRHLRAHLSPRLRRAIEAEESSKAADLLASVRQLLAREEARERVLDQVLQAALAPGGDRRWVVRAGDAAGRSSERQRRIHELIGRFRGVIDERPAYESWAPTPEPDPDEEAQVNAIRTLSIEEQQELAALIRRHQELIDLGFERVSSNAAANR